MSLKRSTVYTTSDSQSFQDKAQAEMHQRALDRMTRLQAAGLDLSSYVYNDDRDNQVVAAEDVRKLIALNGDAILEALTLPATRGRKPATAKAD